MEIKCEMSILAPVNLTLKLTFQLLWIIKSTIKSNDILLSITVNQIYLLSAKQLKTIADE